MNLVYDIARFGLSFILGCFITYIFFRIASTAVFKSWESVIKSRLCGQCYYFNRVIKEDYNGKEEEKQKEK